MREKKYQHDPESMSEPLYSVGQVSHLLDMPQQTVRYFDNTGLVIPSRTSGTDNSKETDPEVNLKSGERRYSIYDIYRISTRRQYQNMGLSLEDTRKIMNTDTLSQIEERLDNAGDGLKRAVERAELHLSGHRKFLERLERIRLYGQRCFFMRRPACWRHIHFSHGVFADDEGAIQARSLAVRMMPLATYAFRFRQEDFLNNPDTDQHIWYVSLESPYAEQVGFDKISGVEFVPEELCAYTVVSQRETNSVNFSMLRGAVDFIRANRMAVRGDVLGNNIVSARDENGVTIRYFEAWFPVRDTETQNAAP